MELDILPITIYSKNKTRLTDFLSDVFEFDYDAESGIFNKLDLKFEIVEAELVENHAVIFNFKVSSEKELREIVSKFNFFLYRNSTQLFEKIELAETVKLLVLTVFDLDNRRWIFKLEKVMQ